MIARYSVPNQAWILLLGSSIIALDNKRFFTTRNELKTALETKGLTLTKTNDIRTKDNG